MLCGYCTRVKEKHDSRQEKCIARIVLDVMNSVDWRTEQFSDVSIALILHAKEKRERPARIEVVNKNISVRIY